ncbi:hypothetical protein GGR54DRAFT_636487 [Hypoxylon sp. NC1633]|nr:hypothetical protein GGR54DRAFT_636487 [Hypoxylon sp. NC1633]
MQFPSVLATLTALLLCQTGLAAPAGGNGNGNGNGNGRPFLGPLKPWTITKLRVSTSVIGRNHTDRVVVSVGIDNPNNVTAGPAPHAAGGGYVAFASSTANCQSSINGNLTTGTNCTEISHNQDGVWSITAVPNATQHIDPHNLLLTFTLNYSVNRFGSVLQKMYKATGRFNVGQNLIDNGCEKGTCTYSLKNGTKTITVTPKLVQCKGTCTMPTGT